MLCTSPRKRTADTTSPAADPARHVRTQPAGSTTPPATPARTLAELRTDHANTITEADALQTRSRTQALTAEEQTKLISLVDTAELLAGEIDQVHTAERLAAQRNRATAPTRPAPAAPTIIVAGNSRVPSEEEGLRIWLNSFGGRVSADDVYRARTAGFDVGSGRIELRADYGGTLNAHKRTISKGADPGQKFIPTTYSDKVTEYLTFFSSVLGLVDSETTNDGNDRTYFVVDDTAMISDYTTASSGTELAPTIPDNDPTLGSVVIKARTITSGYHKLTREAARDTAVSLTDKLAKAIGNSHGRKIEKDVIGGNGTTEAQGLMTASTQFGSLITDISTDSFDDLYFAMPEQYRNGAIWLVSPTLQARMRKKFKDTTGRALFSDAIEGDRRVMRYGGCPVVASTFMPGWAVNKKAVVFVNPLFYLLRLVAGQTIDVLTEKFHPHLAFAGLMSFGGGWLGPAAANQCLTTAASGLAA
ncbi:phage major capsid protein [Limnoglobus roseus]|uniref:Phage major capsid protein n=1 Tax=Limnoglobus roseus TaxID=2598579 RepID=A0A5C1AIQ5_9BACT|nr:phage major capsid protein [Limnoglobus roseus]QEL18535.1 phage major capsid protein [Limnoglobus roseus]